MTYRDVFKELETPEKEQDLFIHCALMSNAGYETIDSEIKDWKTVAQIMSYYWYFSDIDIREQAKRDAEMDMSQMSIADRLDKANYYLELYKDISFILLKTLSDNYKEWNDFENFVKDFSGTEYRTFYDAKKCDDIGFVYIGHEFGTDLYKIGMTKNLDNRESQLRCGNIRLKFIAYKKLNDYSQLENLLHSLYSHKNVEREWFTFTKDEIDGLIRLHGFTYAIDNGVEK